MTQTELTELIAAGFLRDADLSGCLLERPDYRGCRMEGVAFDEGTLVAGNFDNCTTERESFRKAVLRNCPFRRAALSWGDLRHGQIERATFEDAAIAFCDFSRSMLGEGVIMRKALIAYTSLFHASCCEGVNIRRKHPVGHRLLQQNYHAYRRFLIERDTCGTGERKNDRTGTSERDPENSLRDRQRHLPAGRHARRRTDDARHPAHRQIRLHSRKQDTQSVACSR